MSLPILDAKKVSADWETDIFGLVHPPRVVVTFLPLRSWGVYGDGTPMPPEEADRLLEKWSVEWRGGRELHNVGLDPGFGPPEDCVDSVLRMRP